MSCYAAQCQHLWRLPIGKGILGQALQMWNIDLHNLDFLFLNTGHLGILNLLFAWLFLSFQGKVLCCLGQHSMADIQNQTIESITYMIDL